MKKFTPYIVPVISVLLILSILLIDPEFTGLAVFENDEVMIQLNTFKDLVLPENAELEVSIENVSSRLTIKEFIEKTGEEFELVEGKIESLSFEGMGYTGNQTYYLPLSEFGFEDGYAKDIEINVYYGDLLISNQNIIITKR
ncbi:hypothetical protein HOG16_03515 [Candidatus Woesearchaeota archaeon]|jgi:hypothetical protein|nr:hypothetical protein [Candidatus Woesearchaeota archaeon]MBT4321593.1 hypothetical protein [Candidatus Woesearchaeota archaeon]MBT4631096.1 hypothetical protein [Candidatus Woesearchaeota archaeon]